MPTVGEVKYKVGLDNSGIDHDISSTESTISSKLDRISGTLSKQFGWTILKDIGSAFAAAGKAAIGFASDAVQTGQAFDSAMSQVQATLGITAQDIADNIGGAADTMDALREKAQQMGSSTMYSASQAADGLNILAMSGYDAAESMDMIEDVLHLAAAGSMELSEAAQYVAGSMKGFADDTKDAQYYSDLMAKGATLAATNVSQLGAAMSGGAATAAAYGQSADSMTLSLLRLAEQGEVGTAASTALAAAMKNIYTPTDQAATALQELGIAAYDANGNARDFNDVVNELDLALQGYTEEQANAYKQTIFGIQGLDAFNKMTVTGVERQMEWREALAGASDGMGEAAKQYETMTDNLQGDLTAFGSALEGVQIAISDALTPALREFVQLGSEGLGQVTEALKAGDWDGAVQAVADFANQALQKILDMIPAILDVGVQLLTALVQGLLNALPDLTQAAIEIVLMLVDSLADNAELLIDTAVQIIMVLAEGLINAIPELTEAVVKIVTALGKYLAEHFPEILEDGANLLGKLAEGIINAIPKLAEAALKAITRFQLSFTQVNWGQIGINIINGIANGITGAIGTIVDAARNAAQSAFEAAKNFLGINSPSRLFREKIGASIPEGMALGIDDGADDVSDSIISLGEKLTKDVDVNFLPDFGGMAQAIGATFAGSMTQEIIVPVNINGREVARETAWYMNEQLAWEQR